MAITAEFYAANLFIDSQGVPTLTSHVKLSDPDLPGLDLGTKTIVTTRPEAVMAVMQFVKQMLPTIADNIVEGKTLPVTIPTPPVVEEVVG